MEPTGIFKNLTLDIWFKVFVYLGGLLFLASLFFEVKGLTNGQLQLISSGMFFIGLGEWKNQKTLSWIKPANFFTGGPAFMIADIRKPDILGLFFDLIGVILILIGIIHIIWSLF